jgi:hypothetical protein
MGMYVLFSSLHPKADRIVFGQAAIRQGKWKAVWLPPPTGNDKWLLYDLSTGMTSSLLCLIGADSSDPGEITDLASNEPEKLAELVAFWHDYEAETGTVMKDTGDGFGRFTGVTWDDWGQ